MALPPFEGPNSNLVPVFLLRLVRIKGRTTTSTCTFLTGHFDRQVPRVASHLLCMLRKWPMADRYIEPWNIYIQEHRTYACKSGTVIIPSVIIPSGKKEKLHV